jgi:hypothetical protein
LALFIDPWRAQRTTATLGFGQIRRRNWLKVLTQIRCDFREWVIATLPDVLELQTTATLERRRPDDCQDEIVPNR